MSSRTKPTDSSATARSHWDAFRPIRPWQPLWVALGVLFGLPALVLTYLRVVPPTDDAAALVASFISYALPAYLLSSCCFAVALVRARRRAVLGVLTGLSVGLLICHACWLAPMFVPDHRSATGATFTLLSLNMHLGGADAAQLAQQAETADVVVLLEATEASVQRLQPYGWHQRFRFSVGQLRSAAGDTILYSRYPVSQSASLPPGLIEQGRIQQGQIQQGQIQQGQSLQDQLQQAQFQQWITTVAVPRIGQVRIIAAHPCNPYCGFNLWYAEHQQLRNAARANLGRPLIVAGDLNAVDDHGPLLQMRRDGMESVTDILGAGWLPTYPANRKIPPLLPIDHILLDHFLTATSVRRVSIANTDHLGLVAQIARAG